MLGRAKISMCWDCHDDFGSVWYIHVFMVLEEEVYDIGDKLGSWTHSRIQGVIQVRKSVPA